MSLVHTYATASAPLNLTSIMASQATASAAGATGSSQSYLLAPLQSSTSSNVPITPSKARKQAQAQRTRLVALSKHLMTRLQYANFKVEHGWSKQSLPEVENLYYRQNQSSTTIASATVGRQGTSTSPNNPLSKAPSTPSVGLSQVQPSVGSRLFKDVAVKKIDSEAGDVFGGYGLATPPASAGSAPGATSYLTSKRGRSASSTPISPPNTSSNSSASKGGDGRKRSPNNSRTAAGGATTYADFWNRVGSSTASTAPNTVVGSGSRSSVSPSKKRSAEEGGPDSNGPDKASEVGPPTSSPHKRVRMESDPEQTTSLSPAKAALSERGPSFASRKH